MSDPAEDLLAKSKDSIRAAQVLLDQGFPGYAASRAYYAMFYAAEALLDRKGLAFSKHSGVIAAFGLHLVKTFEVPQELHRHIIEAMEIRQEGDYAPTETVTAVDAAEQIARARSFVAIAESRLSLL